MPMPKQLPQIPILGTGHPDARKGIFQQQLQQKSSIVAIGLLLADSFPLDLRRIANPYLDAQFCQQPLEPPGIAGGLHPHTNAHSPRRQFPIELLGLSITVVQSPFTTLSRFCIYKRDVLIARVKIYAYNDHVRLLPPEPLVVNRKSTRAEGVGVVMKSCEVLGILGSLGLAEGQLRTAAPEVARREINQHRPQNEERAVACHEQ